MCDSNCHFDSALDFTTHFLAHCVLIFSRSQPLDGFLYTVNICSGDLPFRGILQTCFLSPVLCLIAQESLCLYTITWYKSVLPCKCKEALPTAGACSKESKESAAFVFDKTAASLFLLEFVFGKTAAGLFCLNPLMVFWSLHGWHVFCQLFPGVSKESNLGSRSHVHCLNLQKLQWQIPWVLFSFWTQLCCHLTNSDQCHVIGARVLRSNLAGPCIQRKC